MRRLVCPTAFKGTFSPLEAARRLAAPGDRILPLSDGGDGFLECLHEGLGGTWRLANAKDPYGHSREVPWLQLPDGTACVESAKVIGIAGLERKDPLVASSLGLAECLAQVRSAPRIWIGLGGTATMDGGQDWPGLDLPPTTAFCDVLTDLADAARIFGPQKGARPEDIPWLQGRLLGLGLPRGPRTGSAGGLGGRLQQLGAELADGASAMLDALGFELRLRGCDAALTGEGRLDRSTLEGKLPLVVALRARALGARVVGHFGSRGDGWELAIPHFDEIRFGLDP